MKPLIELDHATACALQVLAFDVDDTLTADGLLEESAYSAMWLARRIGLKLIAATGRPLGWAKVWSCQWPIDIAIGENGAAAFGAGGDLLSEVSVAERSQGELVESIRSRFPDVVFARDQRERYCDVAIDIAEHVQATEQQIAAYQSFADEVGAISARSSIHFHLQSARWEKGAAIWQVVQQQWPQVSVDEIAFVGDSANDASAFAMFPISVGVANVRASLALLKHKPSFVCEHARGAGFAELVQRLAALRGTVS